MKAMPRRLRVRLERASSLRCFGLAGTRSCGSGAAFRDIPCLFVQHRGTGSRRCCVCASTVRIIRRAAAHRRTEFHFSKSEKGYGSHSFVCNRNADDVRADGERAAELDTIRTNTEPEPRTDCGSRRAPFEGTEREAES